MRPPVEKIPNGAYNRLREPRRGIALHFSAGRSDAQDIGWFKNPACRVSYNALFLDGGDWVLIAPWDRRAWHMGFCRGQYRDRYPDVGYRDANSAFYGLSASARQGDVATPEQLDSMAEVAVNLFLQHGWPLTDTWRITTHSAEAVFPAPDHKWWKGPGKKLYARRNELAYKLGRKADPEGYPGQLGYPLFTKEDIIERMQK